MAKDKHISIYFNRKQLQFVGLEDANIKQLKEAYPGVDIDCELKKMGLWLMSPKGSKRKGNIGFVINWLNNASHGSAKIEIEEETPLRPFLSVYLKELWKGKEHILELNKRSVTS